MKKPFYVLVHTNSVKSYTDKCKKAKKIYQRILQIKKSEDFIETPINFSKVLSVMPVINKQRPVKVCGAFSYKSNPTFCVDQTRDILAKANYNAQIYTPATLFVLECPEKKSRHRMEERMFPPRTHTNRRPPNKATYIPLFKKSLKKIKEVPISKTVYILEREYGLTCANDSRPFLATGGIAGFGKDGCIGILIYNPKLKLAGLAHLFDNKIFSKAFDTIIKNMEQHGLRQFYTHIIRPTESPEIKDQILNTQKKYLSNKKLLSPFQRIPELDIVFDTRNQTLYKKPLNLYLPYSEIKHYGKREIRSGSIFNALDTQLDRCYNLNNSKS